MATAPAAHHSHTSSLSKSGSFTHGRSNSGSFSSGPSLPLGPLSTGLNPNTTKVLLLSGFPPALKTRDIQALFGEWELQGGGLKIKWKDDESCYVIFSEPHVAKRAYLSLISAPPPALQEADGHKPKLVPYTGEDVPSIIQAVQNRPRSRSNASQSLPSAHLRKGSMGSQGAAVGGHQRQQSFGWEGGNGGGMGHASRGSRGSWSQKQMKDMMATEGEGAQGREAPPVPALPPHLVNASPSNSSKSGSNSGDDREAPLDAATAAVASLALEA